MDHFSRIPMQLFNSGKGSFFPFVTTESSSLTQKGLVRFRPKVKPIDSLQRKRDWGGEREREKACVRKVSNSLLNITLRIQVSYYFHNRYRALQRRSAF